MAWHASMNVVKKASFFELLSSTFGPARRTPRSSPPSASRIEAAAAAYSLAYTDALCGQKCASSSESM